MELNPCHGLQQAEVCLIKCASFFWILFSSGYKELPFLDGFQIRRECLPWELPMGTSRGNFPWEDPVGSSRGKFPWDVPAGRSRGKTRGTVGEAPNVSDAPQTRG